MASTSRGEDDAVAQGTTQNIDIPLSDIYVHRLLVVTQYINYTILCQMIDVFGLCTNTINIICFIKQGFKDPVNVSLLGLAIADMGCLATLIWTNICMTPAFNSADFQFHAVEVQHLTTCLTHTTFSRLTGCITALITLERCLCITAPLKVKHIVTSKRVTVVIICIFILLLSSVAPVYVVSRLGMKFFPDRNTSLIAIVHLDNSYNVERVSYAINNVFIPFSAFLVIMICTIILVTELHKKTKWRMQTTNSSQVDNVSTRNQKAAKMVVMISTLFIVSFLPFSVIFIAMTVEPNLSIGGLYNDHLIIAAGFAFILESINSSVNIFFYYRMSSKYRSVFNELFSICCIKVKPSEVTIVSQSC